MHGVDKNKSWSRNVPCPSIYNYEGNKRVCANRSSKVGREERLNQDGSEKEEQKGECEGRIEDS